MGIKAKQVYYKTTVEIPVTAEELITEANGDLFSVCPETARKVAGRKIENGKGKVNFDLTIKKLMGEESPTSIIDDGDKTTVKDNE